MFIIYSVTENSILVNVFAPLPSISIQHNNHRFTAIIQVTALAGTSSEELEDFAGAKFYCPHALADGNQRIRIREKTLEFSSTVLSTLPPYVYALPFNSTFNIDGQHSCSFIYLL